MHLLSFDTQQSSVKPIARQRLLPCQTLGLRDLRFVMRKDQLRTTTMNVIGWPEICQCNRGGLDMPAGPSISPRAIPEYLTRFLATPLPRISRALHCGALL